MATRTASSPFSLFFPAPASQNPVSQAGQGPLPGRSSAAAYLTTDRFDPAAPASLGALGVMPEDPFTLQPSSVELARLIRMYDDVMAGRYQQDSRGNWRDNLVTQTTGRNCGTASIAMMLRSDDMGGNLTDPELINRIEQRYRSFHDRRLPPGSNPAQMTQMLNDWGMSVTDVSTQAKDVLRYLGDSKKVIALIDADGVSSTKRNHYVVIDSVTRDGRLKVLDPSGRSYTMSVAELDAAMDATRNRKGKGCGLMAIDTERAGGLTPWQVAACLGKDDGHGTRNRTWTTDPV
jgi:hypothetical protein